MRYVKCLILATLLLGLRLPAEQGGDPLAGMSLEQLLALDVTSVGKKSERLERAAAAVFVITQEDIRRMGATSIPEALRMAPGLHVARVNGRTWAITARGFNSVFSTKLLVLIDGRSIYTPLFAGVWWDQDVMLDDVDRIEVIRGPAAAIWGANAVNGVINIIMRRSGQTLGNLVTVTAGSEERSITRMRHGSEFGKSGTYRVYGQYSHRLLESPSRNFGNTYWGTLQGGFRLEMAPRDGQELMLQGDIAQGTGSEFEHESYPDFLPASTRRLANHRNSGNVLGRWTVTHRSGAQTTLQGYFDEVNRSTNGVDLDVDTVDAEVQHRRTFGRRQELTLSAGHREIKDRTVGTEAGRFFPPQMRYGITQFSAVDGISLWGDRIQVTLGARVEHNTFSQWSVQPTSRAQWSINRSHSVWGAVSRAIRAPSRLEGGFEHVDAASGYAFGTYGGDTAETLVALEAGYRWKLGKRLMVDLAGFRNRYDDLSSTEFQEVRYQNGVPLYWHVMTNLARAKSWGAEGVVSWNAAARWRLSGSYTGLWMKYGIKEGGTGYLLLAMARSVPVHQGQLQSSVQLRRNLQWNTNLYYYGLARIDQRGPLPVVKLPARMHADMRVAWRAGESVEWSIGVRNLTADRTWEYFVEPGPTPERPKRAVYCRVTWRF